MTAQPTRDQLRVLAARAADDGYTGNDDYGHLTVSPAVLTAILDQLDTAEQRIRDLTQEVRDERGAALDQMEQVKVRDARIERLENRAETETARANEWRRKHRVMAGKRTAAHCAYVEEREARRVAETRLQAVRDVLDTYEDENAQSPHRYPTPHGDGLGPTLVDAGDIRRALDT